MKPNVAAFVYKSIAITNSIPRFRNLLACENKFAVFFSFSISESVNRKFIRFDLGVNDLRNEQDKSLFMIIRQRALKEFLVWWTFNACLVR